MTFGQVAATSFRYGAQSRTWPLQATRGPFLAGRPALLIFGLTRTGKRYVQAPSVSALLALVLPALVIAARLTRSPVKCSNGTISESADEDLGRTASGAVERPGFERLVDDLCTGQVGAVLCLEASRLSRNGPDWHRLKCDLLSGMRDVRRPMSKAIAGKPFARPSHARAYARDAAEIPEDVEMLTRSRHHLSHDAAQPIRSRMAS